MDPSQITRAATRGLLRHGLTENMAENIAYRMVQDQSDEWNRILARCEQGEVPRLYVIVSHRESRIQTFVYAPGEVDNIADVIEMLGTRFESGWVGVSKTPMKRAAYPVSVFDIAQEVCAAVKARA